MAPVHKVRPKSTPNLNSSTSSLYASQQVSSWRTLNQLLAHVHMFLQILPYPVKNPAKSSQECTRTPYFHHRNITIAQKKSTPYTCPQSTQYIHSQPENIHVHLSVHYNMILSITKYQHLLHVHKFLGKAKPKPQYMQGQLPCDTKSHFYAQGISPLYVSTKALPIKSMPNQKTKPLQFIVSKHHNNILRCTKHQLPILVHKVPPN